ncbi:MAG TPA: hypothetical protein VLA61_07095 [Ideonella sp.]|uniref:hypothetical protein n=1 Tax=Ideonella sp. TaxID=1929293 RepID=UPI002CEE61C0|nr:hypothetical protein [Ideonella sp.]HSI48018.1 hypothetical protein [Ideonella sp.]
MDWGQYKTPSKLVVETDKFYVITKESILNPQGCAVPGSGVVVRQALVGSDAYKQLYALFLMASMAQRQVEFNVSADCSFGPNVVGAALSTP